MPTFLITTPPVLSEHGTYHYYVTTKERALKWIEEHHKEIQICQGVQQTDQVVNLCSQAIDRYLPNGRITVPPLAKHDEALVAIPQGNPFAPLTSLENLVFAFYTRLEDHQHHKAE